MNDFKTQLNGLLATLHNLPDVEQQNALALLQSSLACQLGDSKLKDGETGVKAELSTTTENSEQPEWPSPKSSQAEALQHRSEESQHDLLELINDPKLSELRENSSDGAADVLSHLPPLSQDLVQDTHFPDKIKVEVALQHHLPDLEASCSDYSQTHDQLKESNSLLKDSENLPNVHDSCHSNSTHYEHSIYGVDLKGVCSKDSIPLQELSDRVPEVSDVSDLDGAQYHVDCQSNSDGKGLTCESQEDNRVLVITSSAVPQYKNIPSTFNSQISSSEDSVHHAAHQQKQCLSVIHVPEHTGKVDKAQQCLPYPEVFHGDGQVIDPGGLPDHQQLPVSLISSREAEELALVSSEELERTYQESLDAYHLKGPMDPEKNTYIMMPVLDKVKYVKVDVDLGEVGVAGGICLEESCDRVLSTDKTSSLSCSLERLLDDTDKENDKGTKVGIDEERNPIDLSTFTNIDCSDGSNNCSKENKSDYFATEVDEQCSSPCQTNDYNVLSKMDMMKASQVVATKKRKRKTKSSVGLPQGQRSCKRLKSHHIPEEIEMIKEDQECGLDNTQASDSLVDINKEPESPSQPEEVKEHNNDDCIKTVEDDEKPLSGDEDVQTETEKLLAKSGEIDLTPNMHPVSCRNCKTVLADVSLLSGHQKQCDGHLTCSYCQAKFNHKVTYIKHVQGHKRNGCTKCPKNFCNHKKLKAHMKSEHKVDLVSKTYSCSYCNRTFLKRSSLYYHFKIHAEDNEIVCKRCGKFCKDQESYKSHMDEHSRASKFHCDICSASFTRRQQYDDHLKHHKKNKCEICGQPFTNKKELVRHCRIEHNTVPQNVPPEPQYNCDKCDRIFNRPSLLQQHQLRQHQQSHAGINSLECRVCEKKFFDKRSLRKHMSSINHKNYLYLQNDHSYIVQDGFSCDSCNRKLPSKKMLLIHSKICHKVGVTWSCSYCDYKTKRHYALKTHMELHAGKRNFMCELCGSSFHALATLKDHHNFVHSDERKYKCKECDKSFKNKSTLERHRHTHSDARPFECSCGFSYKRLSHLKRHMYTVHKLVMKSRTLKKFKRLEELENAKDKSPISQEEPPQITDFSDADEFEFVSVSSSLSSAVPKILTDIQGDESLSKNSTNVLLTTQDNIMLMGENSSTEQGHLITVGDSQIIQLIPSTFQIPQDSSFQTVSLVPAADLHAFSMPSGVPFSSVNHCSDGGVEAFSLTSSSDSVAMVSQASDNSLGLTHTDDIRTLRALNDEALVPVTSSDREGVKQESKQVMTMSSLGSHEELPMSSSLHTFDYPETNHTLLPSLLPHHTITSSHSPNSQINPDLLQQNLMCTDFVLPVDGDR